MTDYGYPFRARLLRRRNRILAERIVAFVLFGALCVLGGYFVALMS